MTTRQSHSPESRVGFLTVGLGGVGLDAIEQYQKRYQVDQRPFPNVTMHIDTDPLSSELVDEHIHIGFKDHQIEALQVLSPVENGGAFRGKIWVKMAAHMCAVRESDKMGRQSHFERLQRGARKCEEIWTSGSRFAKTCW